MKSLQQFRIPFTGLKPGKHNFEFEVNDTFFREFEYSLVKNGELRVQLELDKQETMLILNFHISGNMYPTCDVCLAEFPFRIEAQERQIAKFDSDSSVEDDTEEIIVLGKNEHDIDVSKLIYEYITLAAPYINRCNDEGNTEWCDKGMIKKLHDLSSPKEENDADPRWEALKKIKNN